MKQILQDYSPPKPKKAPSYHWQQIALDCLEYLENPVKSQVFKYAKKEEGKLKSAIEYMKSKNIRNFLYLAKIMSG